MIRFLFTALVWIWLRECIGIQLKLVWTFLEKPNAHVCSRHFYIHSSRPNLSHAKWYLNKWCKKKMCDAMEKKASYEILRSQRQTHLVDKELGTMCSGSDSVTNRLHTFHYTHSHALQSYLTCHVHISHFLPHACYFALPLWLAAFGSLTPSPFSLKSQEKQKKNGFRNALYLSNLFFFFLRAKKREEKIKVRRKHLEY